MPKQVLTFKYLPIPKRDQETGEIIGEVYIPVVPVRISYGHQLGRVFYALVDSGAERNLFPAELGEILGVKIKKGNPQDIIGIGKVQIKGFTHKIKLYVGSEGFNADVDLSYEQQVPLLGRNGFFNLFKRVVFKENDKILELER